MYSSGDSENPIEALLSDALILPDYDLSQAPTAAERIVRALARGHRSDVVCHSDHAGPETAARQELDLISARVLNTAQAAASLAQLGIADHAEPEDALVFGCLLHLIGRDEGAQFLWQYAAGSGIPEAARCLLMHYESNGDRHDAHYWRAEWQRLEQQAELQGEPALPPAAWHELLPERAAKQLIAQCLRGLQPELPTRLKETVNELVIEYDDESLGKIPRPRRRPDALGAHH